MAYEWMEPVDTWQEHCDHEFNSMFDCRSEAHDFNTQDNEEEAYFYYCDECDDQGIKPKPFKAWRDEFLAKQGKRRWEVLSEPALNEDDMPF